MAKKKTPINPMQGKRLKKLLQEARITQKDLSEEITKHFGGDNERLSQQRISDIINGRAPLTIRVINLISDLPRFDGKDLLKEWLLCEEQFTSSEEKILNEKMASRYEGDLLLTGVSCFLNLSGYEVTTIEKKTGNDFELETIIIEKDNSTIKLSPSKMSDFGTKVLHLFEVFTHDYFN